MDQSQTTARMMIEAMSLPMLGEMADQPGAWAAPGMIADRAHAWSVAQERSSSDLALDFVTPELVLAARVYGLGPAEAAQAARLAIVGPGQLGAMASTVDRTFVEAMAIGREARSLEARSLEAARRRSAAAGDGDTGDVGGVGGPARDVIAGPRVAPGVPGEPRATITTSITTAFPTADGEIAAAVAPVNPAIAARASQPAQPPPSSALFGVDRRAPRGAFLWPSATVAALGMTATGSDGQLSMSVAALELLAAQVVAELGTYTALSEVDAATRGVGGAAPGAFGAAPGVFGPAPGAFGAEPAAGAPSARFATSGAASAGRPGATPVTALGAASAAALGAAPAAHAERRDASQAGSGAEPAEADVLGAAAAFVPASRRARFDALYVALSQSTAGRSWSPAARAARALALAGRGDDSITTARERAAAAWDVLPVVYPSAGDPASGARAGSDPETSTSTSGSAASSRPR